MEFHIDCQGVLDRFLRYVQVDSETGFEKEFCDLMRTELDALGFTTEIDQPPSWVGTNGYNIYGTLPGEGDLEAIFFSAHMDTVTNGKGIRPQVCEDGYVRSDGSTILGGDDKAGIAAILEAVTAAKSLSPRPTIQVILSVREEAGLLGAKALDFSKIVAKRGIVLDSGGDAHKITTSSPGQNKISISIQGKGAHAGIAPEAGISAIQVAAEAVSKMNLLRIDQETTSNIGTFSAKSPTNIVCDQAELVLEVRSRNQEKLEAQTQHILSAVEDACQKFGASFQSQVDLAYQGFHLLDEEPIVQEVVEACKTIGLSPETLGSGGGSDANEYNAKGIPTVNLAIGMEKVHTVQEQQNIQQMYLAGEICYQVLKKYAK